MSNPILCTREGCPGTVNPKYPHHVTCCTMCLAVLNSQELMKRDLENARTEKHRQNLLESWSDLLDIAEAVNKWRAGIEQRMFGARN